MKSSVYTKCEQIIEFIYSEIHARLINTGLQKGKCGVRVGYTNSKWIGPNSQAILE